LGDPFKAGRDGSQGLAQIIEMHWPLKLTIIMLGSNDFQCMHRNNAWLSAQGSAKLIETIRGAPIELSMPIPEIMLVSPPAIIEPKGEIARKFRGAENRCSGLAEALATIAKEYTVRYFDAGVVADACPVDGIHLDEDQHRLLGKALARTVSAEILQ
jgi:lysophospholipase L1-like esterase